MKRILFLFFLFAISSVTFAQTQQGRVKTRGRLNANGTVTPGKGISGATVTLGNGNSQVSGNNGTFSFAVSKGTYLLKNVQKQNYQLCDRDLLGRNKKYSTDILEIAMQTPDEALEDRLESEEKIRATLIAELNKQKAELRHLKEQQRISQQEYNEKLRALYDAQSNNEKLISDMAERYSTMDFDQMDEFQRKVAFYIQNGELARADSLLNTQGTMDEQEAELDRIHAANIAGRENLQKSEKMEEVKLENFATNCYSRYEMCKLQHKNDSAAYWLERRASKDSLNIDWQLEAGTFISNYLADYEKTLKYFQTALNNALNSNNEEYVATSYNNLGGIYDSQGDYARALEYYTKALDILKKIFGEEHPAVATSYNNLGFIYSSQGDYARALEYYTKALDIRKKIFGEEHPDVATSYNNLGGIYDSQGDYARALEYYTKALDIQKKIFGEEHPAVATSYNNIGFIYDSQGDYARALEYYTKALDIQKKIFGEEHPAVATSYNNLGGIYDSQGDYVRALEYYLHALHIFMKASKEESSEYALTFMNVHKLYDKLESNGEVFQEIKEAFSSMAYTLTCIDGDTPAKQQGMSGEYIVLKFDDWSIQGEMSLINKNNELRGKPKTIVVMKDGVISEHFFADKIGAQISCKYVCKKEKQRMIEAYEKWATNK